MEKGFISIGQFLNETEASNLEKILRKYHEAWLAKNLELYQERGAINSAYLTNGDFLKQDERLELLKFVGSKKVVSIAKKILGEEICFLNTQLFFNPYKGSQKNYWHRDIQYTRNPLEDQRKVIESKKTDVLHLRFAFSDEPGLEFIPYSHFRWDTELELETRLEKNQKVSHDELEGSEIVPLKRGDLLVFDANIIHRGLYGNDRFSLDILFCRPEKELTQFIDKKTYPTLEEFSVIECREVFEL